MTAEVTTVDAGERAVARRVLVNAPAAEVFALVADPHRHPELDGSGTVRDVAVDGPHELAVGARFRVRMQQMGARYAITSTVTALEEDRLVEWQHPFGHRWRWELAEATPGVTTVTEVFDYSTAKAPQVMELFRMTSRNARGITATLEQLAARFS